MSVVGLDLLLVALLLTLVCTALARPLQAVLTELCGAESRGRFWVVLAETALAGSVLLTSALSFTPPAGAGVVGRLAGPLRGASVGALLGLGVIVLVVLAFDRRAQSDA